MGFFDMFTRKVEEVRFSDIDQWLDRKIADKKLDQTIAKAKDSLLAAKVKVFESLEELNNSKLLNEKIPVREKQILDGHKKTYAQRVSKFLEELDLPDQFSDVGHFVARFSERLESLAKDTSRNVMVVRQFNDNEVSAIGARIKALSDVLSTLQSEIDKAGVETIREAKIRMRQYKDDVDRKERLGSLLKAKDAELTSLRTKNEKLLSKVAELKESGDYKNFEGVIAQKSQVESEMAGLEQELISTFAELNRPLKKFSHLQASEILVDRYIADPAGALVDDQSIEIYHVIQNMSDSLEALDLKERQLEKVREVVSGLSRDFFDSRRNKLIEAKEKSTNLAVQINRSIIALNISENETWARSIEGKIKFIESQMEKISAEIEQINLPYLAQRVKEKIKEVDGKVKVLEDEVDSA